MNDSARRVTVVIVTYQSEEIVGGGLQSLKPAYDAGLLACVVVDNSPTDSTLSFVREHYSWVDAVASGGNIGYGRACNIGLERCQTEYIMFMNPDARIGLDGVRVLIEFLDQHEQAGAIAPAIREGDHLQHAGVLPTPMTILRRAAASDAPALRQVPIEPGGEPFKTDWICGALIITRTELMKEIGGFDPNIFLYFDETDLCRRLLNRNWELWAVGQAVAHHSANASAEDTGAELLGGCIAEHYYRSRYYYLVKHHGRFAAIFTELTELALLALRGFVNRLRGRKQALLATRLRFPVMRKPSFPGAKTE